jgi:SAM-dependent methyltransferase
VERCPLSGSKRASIEGSADIVDDTTIPSKMTLAQPRHRKRDRHQCDAAEERMDDALTTNLGLSGVTPWGRQAFEYIAFFALREDCSPGRILDCGAGPSSFTAEMSRRGWDVTAVDPLYRLDGKTIDSYVDGAKKRIGPALAIERERFSWNFYGSPEELFAIRDRACDLFLKDYASGRREGRYVEGRLPSLNFGSDAFELALCSHFLFLYSDFLDEVFHVQSLLELSRVAREVRVFPLVKMDGAPAQYLAAARSQLEQRGLIVSVDPVPFEFQRGATSMLRICR